MTFLGSILLSVMAEVAVIAPDVSKSPVLGNLFLVSPRGSSLEAVEYEVYSPSGAQSLAHAWARAVMSPGEDLQSPFPKGTRVRHLFLLQDGTAVVDLSKEAAGLRPGATLELLTAYSLVLTLTKNVPEVQRVFILIDGKRKITLAGHLGLERALEPLNILVGPEKEEEEGPNING